MTALLSVGAWAQSLQTVTLFEKSEGQATTNKSKLSIDKEKFKGARVGSQLNIYYTTTGQGNVVYFGNAWKSVWSNADGTAVSALLDNDVISSSDGLSIYPQSDGVTLTVTKVTLNYNGVDYLYNAESFTPNKYNGWNGALQLDLTNASVGDVLAISFSTAGGKLWFLSGQGDPEALTDVATLVDNASISDTTYTYTIANSVFNDITVGQVLEFTTNENGIEATINIDGGAVVATNQWWKSASGEVTSDNIEAIKTNGIKVTVASGTTLTVKQKKVTEGRPTLYETIEGYTTESPLYIPVTETMKGYSGLYLSGETYTASSVDLIYKPSAVSIGTTGYATFGYPFAVDLSGLSEGQDAYTVSVSGTTATLSSVKGKKIPANTGIILKGSGDVTIPLTTATTDAIGTNNLHVSDGTVTGSSGNIYVLAKKNDVVGFYKLSSSATVPAGKAYLQISGGAALAPAFIGFGDGTTGIDEVRSNTEEVRSDYHDLQGRRVAQPTKGLYIVNGKKVVIK